MTVEEMYTAAVEHQQAGRLSDAQRLCREILLIQPGHADALQMQAVMAHQAGRTAEGVSLLRRAIQFNPRAGECHANLGMLLGSLGRLDEALASLRTAIELRPDDPAARFNYAKVLKDTGQLEPAITEYHRVVATRPGFAAAHNNLGAALHEAGRFDEAVEVLRNALARWPAYPECHFNLGLALQAKGDAGGAIAAYRRAIELKGDYAAAFSHLGTLLYEQHDLDAAIASSRGALSLRPDNLEATITLASALEEDGEIDEATALLRQAESIRPDPRIGSRLLHALHCARGYDRKRLFDEHVRWRRAYADELKPYVRPHANNRSPDRRLRVAYSGAFLGNYAQGRSLLPLLSKHDHDHFEIVCYSDLKHRDALTAELERYVESWRDTASLNESKFADLVRRDGIDILVDLSMHSRNSRVLAFALKPAPVQATALGYCSTTGLQTIDYRLTDPFLDPPDVAETFYTEKSVRLPHCCWCYAAPREAPAVGPLPAQSSPGVTFGCLNELAKVNGEQLDLWASILKDFSQSRFIMPVREGSVRARIAEHFSRQGVAPQRTMFVPNQPLPQLLSLCNQIDIALDTFPCAGDVTTMDALWMGVPVVTLAGQTGVSRAGLSILSNLGVSDLVAADAQQYAKAAIDLARNLPRLTELRQSLRQRMQASVLMDAARFAKDVEAAYRQMWKNWCDRPADAPGEKK